MVIYLAFFGLIILIVAAAVVLGAPAVEEGTGADKPEPPQNRERKGTSS